ncbi:MAG TPA: ABC transporter permease [Planctomycetota bacterium]|nr:ABC transporter permease [Planctomycetota bacterium]
MKGRFLALLVPPTAWLVVFLVIPTAVLALAGFSAEGLKALGEPVTWLLFWRSFRIALVSTAFCLVVSYPVACFIAGCSPRWRSLLLFLIVLPFWTNLLVRTYALKFCLDPLGWSNSEAAVVVALVQSFLPFMILPLYSSIEKLPVRLLEASQDLGASPARTFWSVTVPLTMPGIAAGCILVFIPILGIFALPEFIDERTPMVGSQINLYFMKNRNPGAGSALTLILMVLTITLTGIYSRFRKSEGLV